MLADLLRNAKLTKCNLENYAAFSMTQQTIVDLDLLIIKVP